MKIWQKIFIYSLLLFLIVFNFGAYFLIENSHNLSLKREITRSLEEHKSLSTGIVYYSDFINQYSDIDLKNNTGAVLFDYLRKVNTRDIYLEVLDKDNYKVFSNLDFNINIEREEIENPLVDKRKYIIRDIDNKSYLFATNLLEIKDQNFKFSYIRDISYIYEDREEQYNIFLKTSIIVSIILAIGMYILSKYITKPINKLIKTTKTISNGNYTERVRVTSKDEIGILAENFNEMAFAIEEKINQLENEAKEKQIFIDNLTHEIKTPLTSIIGYSDFLRSISYDEETFTEGLSQIFDEGKRLEDLSWKMMDLILLKKENFKMTMQNIDSVLIDVNNILQPKLKDKKISLIISSEKCEILAEKDLIKNLIINLIDNSIKASDEYSNIYIYAYKNKEDKVILEIKDDGIGIPEEHLPRIFNAFYVVDKSRTRANNGVGLGLSICAEILEIHEADLEIKSEVNKGTIIKIIFN